MQEGTLLSLLGKVTTCSKPKSVNRDASCQGLCLLSGPYKLDFRGSQRSTMCHIPWLDPSSRQWPKETRDKDDFMRMMIWYLEGEGLRVHLPDTAIGPLGEAGQLRVLLGLVCSTAFTRQLEQQTKLGGGGRFQGCLLLCHTQVPPSFQGQLVRELRGLTSPLILFPDHLNQPPSPCGIHSCFKI